MSAAQLFTDLARLGIQIEAHGDRLRYSPRSAVTPDLADRMKAHKSELLAILRRDAEALAIDLTDASKVWQAALERIADDPRFTPEVLAAMRLAEVDWADAEAREERFAIALEGCGLDPAETIDPADVVPCPDCGRLELWETLAGHWRCLRCDPPTTARRLRELVAQLKNRPYGFARNEDQGRRMT